MNKENSTLVPNNDPIDTAATSNDPQPVTQDSELTTQNSPRKRGGQPGNQNARTHGFYSKKAGLELREAVADAGELEGLDAEIEYMRAKIQQLEQTAPTNFKLIFEAIRSLSLVMSRRRYAGRGNVITDTARKIFGGFGAVGIIKDALDGMGVFKE